MAIGISMKPQFPRNVKLSFAIPVPKPPEIGDMAKDGWMQYNIKRLHAHVVSTGIYALHLRPESSSCDPSDVSVPHGFCIYLKKI